MKLSVVTHKEWKAVSNGHPEDCQPMVAYLHNENDDLDWAVDFFSKDEHFNLYRVVFEETPKLSPYLWTVNVGHYNQTHCGDGYPKLPISLLTRTSTSVHQDSIQHCFDICKSTIDFFEHIFGKPYPFSKLDLVLCPMVRYTAMECAGCIVFTENMLGGQRL